MKVKELIELLETCNSDYPVYFEFGEDVYIIRDCEQEDDTQSVTLY